MSLQDNKSLVRRFYEKILNTGNIDLLEHFISPEYAEVHDGKRHVIGIEGAREHILGVR